MVVLLQMLKGLGWEDGKTVVFEYRYGGNDADRLAAFADELVRLNVDLISTAGDLSTHAARRATTTVPIVAVVGFPVESGFVKSLARPGGNITGFASLADDVSVKRLELLKELLPGLSRVAVLWDPVTHERQPKAAEVAAPTLGLHLQLLRARSPDELGPAFEAAARARAEALLVLVSPMFLGNRAAFASLAARHRIPTMHFSQASVESGGLIAYGPFIDEQWRVVATAVDKILKGARPADLPVQQPSRFELSINLKTARALGLTIPPSLLQRADRVIQ
ncbi:MAG: ABC transporter substrate-binding protein [Candidatus Rokubacteria bacterium]|nr:ABC transporter substrate-binding protein [Candidatus Rokubacteria bacterium]